VTADDILALRELAWHFIAGANMASANALPETGPVRLWHRLTMQHQAGHLGLGAFSPCPSCSMRVIRFYPTFQAFLASRLTNWDLMRPAQSYVGLANYQENDRRSDLLASVPATPSSI
jgi:hypothetical protein